MTQMEEAMTYPMESDNWIVTVATGGVLLFLSFLLVPLFLVYGYLVDVVQDTTAGAIEPPAFVDWKALLVDGLQAWVIGVIYLLVPIIVGAITVGGSVMAIATGSEVGAAAGFGGLAFGFGLTFVLSLAFGYVAVAALVNFAREDQFSAAFDVDVLKEVLLQRDYAVTWLVSVVVFIVASFVNAIPVIGTILAPFVLFYAGVVAARLWANGFADALNETGTAEPAGTTAV